MEWRVSNYSPRETERGVSELYQVQSNSDSAWKWERNRGLGKFHCVYFTWNIFGCGLGMYVTVLAINIWSILGASALELWIQLFPCRVGRSHPPQAQHITLSFSSLPSVPLWACKRLSQSQPCSCLFNMGVCIFPSLDCGGRQKWDP